MQMGADPSKKGLLTNKRHNMNIARLIINGSLNESMGESIHIKQLPFYQVDMHVQVQNQHYISHTQVASIRHIVIAIIQLLYSGYLYLSGFFSIG
jgi:hypothetical protein